MNIESKLYGTEGPDGAEPLSPKLQRMNDWVLQTLGVVLRNFGIKQAKLDVTKSGLAPVIRLHIKPMKGIKPPQVLSEIDFDMMNGVAKSLMVRFGISDISITLTKAERKELQEYWEYIDTGITAESAAADALDKLQMKLELDIDPGDTVSNDA